IDRLKDLLVVPRIYVYATGAGAGIQKKIWEVPGCSSFLVGCSFPYATTQTSKCLGFTPEKSVSTDTAIELAIAAYLQAYEPGSKSIGIGLTASVASVKTHRGAHRIIVSSFSETECLTATIEIPKGCGLAQRFTDGELSDSIGITAILRAAHILDDDQIWSPIYEGTNSENVASERIINYIFKYLPVDTTERAKELILKNSFFQANGSRVPVNAIDTNKIVFYPGSFNPFHFGHDLGAEAIKKTIAKKFGECRDIVYTTVVNPLHKPPLTVAEMLNRVSIMKGKNFCLTIDDPLFIDKARCHPGAWFGMGADTLLNMLDPKWGYLPRH